MKNCSKRDACISHHSAFEVFGYGSQVFYECYVATDSRFTDFEKIAGLEEVLRCLMLVPGLNEEKVLASLKRNENGFLYQKCGYLFEQLKDEFGFSNDFFEECKRYSSGAKRYLMKDPGKTVFQEKWKLYTPPSLKELIDKGVNDYDAIG